MSSQPPRRRRPPSDEDERGGGLPMVPIFAGVIVAGLGIGALLSAFASRRGPPPAQGSAPIVVTHTPTPIAQRSVAAATAAPASAPVSSAPTPTEKPSVKASEKPSEKPSVRPTEALTPKPIASPSPKPAPRRTVAARTPPPATATPVATAPPATPTRVAQVLTPVPVDPLVGASQNLVRRYLEAVARGDDGAAYSALGGPSGNRLTEQPFLDPSMRITSLTATRNPAGGAKVQVELVTAKGQYFGTFSVDADGTMITSHAMIPVGGTTAR